MKHILNECSKAQLWQLLDQVTQNAVVESSCLEDSRSREQAYSKGSLNRWHEIAQLILKLPNRGVCLDIGTSPLTFVLPNFFQDVHTLDFTDVMSERCSKAGVRLYSGGIAEQNGKVAAPVPDNTYDCILFLEVIEHLHLNPIDVITMLKAKLRPGGTLILSTPNMMSLGNRIKMLCNMKLNHFHYPPFAENEHPQHGHRHDRIFMPAEMKEYFACTGWSSYSIGFHGLQVSDVSHGKGCRTLLSKALQEPMKVIFPSLRQLMLIQART